LTELGFYVPLHTKLANLLASREETKHNTTKASNTRRKQSELNQKSMHNARPKQMHKKLNLNVNLHL